jgi:hypothetical protein
MLLCEENCISSGGGEPEEGVDGDGDPASGGEFMLVIGLSLFGRVFGISL